jgi:simple sugar transport system permease protein
LTIALAAPLILAAMGGYTSERSGVINISLEGLMLMSAAITAICSVAFGPILGPLLGVLSAIILSLVHWLATQVYNIDHVVSGMAINLLSLGGTNYLWAEYGEQRGTMPDLLDWAYYAMALAFPFCLWWYTKRTRGGLRLVAIGADPEKARLVGLRPVMIRFWALTATGVFVGLGGASLVAYTGIFTDNMTAGRGYIALAALILGGWRPLPTLGVCLGLGFLSSLQLFFQGGSIPSQAWAALPYLATIVALAGLLGKNRTPAGLGRP